MFEQQLRSIRWDLWPRRTTQAQHVTLLRILAIAAEQRLALAPLLSAFAQDETGQQHRRLARLAECVAEGTALPDAVEQIPGILPTEAVLAIRFGSESGTLSATLRSYLDHTDAPFHNSALALRDIVRYGLIVLIFTWLMMLFLQIKVIPTYAMILEDFDAEPPWIFQWVWYRGGSFSQTCYVAFAAILLLAALIRAGCFRHSWAHGLLARLGRPFVDLRTNRVLRHLSVALDAGRPLAGSVSTLARHHPDAALRNQLLFVRNEIEHGTDPWTSMCEAGLVSSAEAQVLDSATRTGNPAWALQDIAQQRQDRMGRRLAVGLELLRPAVVIALGLMVGIVAISMFSPLITMLQYLA